MSRLPRPANPFLQSNRNFTINLPTIPVRFNVRGRGPEAQQVRNILRQMLPSSLTNDTPRNIRVEDTMELNNGIQHPANVQRINAPPLQDITLDIEDQTTGQGHDTDQNNSETQSGSTVSAGSELYAQKLIKWLGSALPFLLILLAKEFYDHRLGFLVLVGLCETYRHVNNQLVRRITQRESGNTASIVWIIFFISCTIILIYGCFAEEKLYYSLILVPPVYSQMNLLMLLWFVFVNDFIIKFIGILIKCAFTVIPASIIKRKGKYYMLIENLTQYYRCIVPITPWLCFILDETHGGEWVSIILLIIYVVIKANHLWGRTMLIYSLIKKFKLDVSYATSPSKVELDAMDNSCAICQDKFREPVKLSCSHIFCDDCVSLWFDREKSCPMCRAVIVIDNEGRDGATPPHIQLY